MDNPETPATLGTRATEWGQMAKQQQKQKNKTKNKKQTNKNWKDEQHEPTKKPGVKRCSRHVTHIVKAGTNSLDNGGNKKNLRKR